MVKCNKTQRLNTQNATGNVKMHENCKLIVVFFLYDPMTAVTSSNIFNVWHF